MHIGMVTETYPPETNGVALTVEGLVEGLRAHGHRVTLVRPCQDVETGRVCPPGTLRVASAAIPGYPGLCFGLPAGRRITRQWKADRPDAVYVATEGPLGASAMRSARRLGIPATTGFHTRFDAYASHYGVGWLTPLVLGYLRRFHRRADATLVPTESLARELRTIGMDNVRMLHRAVDTRQFHPRHRDSALRRSWGVAEHTPVALYVGRIAPEKNLQLAVRAFYAMRKRCPGMRYVWVGDGPARHAVEQAHPEFIFAGMRHGEDLARYYASADLFVFPSLSETFGNVILEALASGLPTVAFDCGAAHEFLRNGVNGFSVPNGDEHGFVSACLRMLRQGHVQAWRDAARDSVAALSPEAVIADFESILAAVIAGRASRAARMPRFTGSSADQGVQP